MSTMSSARLGRYFATAFIATFLLSIPIVAAGAPGEVEPEQTLLKSHVAPVVKTYIFAHPHWWETPDHQTTSIVTLLSLGRNISATVVVPPANSPQGGPRVSYAFVGDFYDEEVLRKVQPIMTPGEFRDHADYKKLKALAKPKTSTLSFPKASQESYETTLNVISSISERSLSFGMPDVDPDGTQMSCARLKGTVHHSLDGTIRFVFMDRLHFYHVCTEKYMPWWYDVRRHLVPRKEYMIAARNFAEQVARPLTVVHVRDLMESTVKREDEEIQRYARQIADAFRRKNPTAKGTLYLTYASDGQNVARVVQLFREEFPDLKTCDDMFRCGADVPPKLFKPKLDAVRYESLFGTQMGSTMLEIALSSVADHFVGNVYSPYSRNIALYRKLSGKTYDVLKGFGELRRMTRWNL